MPLCVSTFHASPFRLPVPGIRTPELVLIHGILAIRGAGTEREVFQYLIVEVDITIELTIPIVDISGVRIPGTGNRKGDAWKSATGKKTVGYMKHGCNMRKA